MKRIYSLSIFFLSILFFCFTLTSCGGGGGGDGGDGTQPRDPPSISNLSYSPKSALLNTGEGTFTVSGTIDFTDEGGNLSTLTVTTFNSSGNAISSNTLTIPGVLGSKSGRVNASFVVPTSTFGNFTFQVYATDSAGDESNELTGTFTVGELELVGRWPEGPVWAVVAGEINGVPYAFLGGGSMASAPYGIVILDISDPSMPAKVGETTTSGTVEGLFLSGNLLLATDWSGGRLRIYDISNPARPLEVGSLDTRVCCPSDVTATGSLSLVVSGNAGVLVIDISDPINPKEVGVYSRFNGIGSPLPEGVAVVGSIALVTGGGGGLSVVDISDPTTPTEIGSFNTPGFADGVEVSDRLVLVADGDTGLSIIDISNSISPREVGFFNTGGSALDVVASGSLALVADSNAGLTVIDISDPTSPKEVGFYDTLGNARGVAAFEEFALVADQDGGLAIVRLFP